jgi:hypothetical protein
MNKLRPTIKLALFISVAGAFLAACSDDDDKKPSAPSKIITGIRVYKITDVISYEGDLDFTYDKDKRLTSVRGNAPLTTINYSYGDNSYISYNYSSENSPLVEITTTLENGRSYVCKFSNQDSPITYSYNNEGYLKSSNNNGIVLEYQWNKKNLTSITSTPRGTYNSDYKISTIANDYSLDLNTLAQWIDERPNYINVVNTLGQMAGILGKRSENIIEDTYYTYDYSFLQDGRLKDITLIDTNKTGYSFLLRYADSDNIE